MNIQTRHKQTLKFHTIAFSAAILSLSLTAFSQQEKINWNQFRGPNGQGIAKDAHIPVNFSPESNILWKTAIGPGQSSPVIWDDRIFLTEYESTNEMKLTTLSIDRTDGRILWRQVVQAETKQNRHPMNSPVSATPTADEKHVYVYFPTYGLICYDHVGNRVWHRNIDTPKNHFGTATSPILHDDNVILLLDGNDGTSRLLAVNRDSGNTAWQQPRSLFRAGWSTPMIWRNGDTEELIVLGFKRLTSYKPSTGEEIWWAGGFSPETMGVPVTGEGLLFTSAAAMAGRGDDKWDAPRTWKAITERFDRNNDNQIERGEMTEGFTIPLRLDLPTDNPGWGVPTSNMEWIMGFFDKDKNRIIDQDEWLKTMSSFSMDSQPTLLAICPGATGDARKSHVVWEIHQGLPETPSILYTQGKLYLLRDGGQLTCLEAATGKELFREKIGASGQYVASPIVAGDKLVVASVSGTVTVLQVDDKLNILAKNNFKEKIFATPAIAENKIYLRTTENLYAIGK